MTISRLLAGIVVESKVPSAIGEYLYSDFAIQNGIVLKNCALNNLAQIPFLGFVAGVARIALATIHTVGHLIGYASTNLREIGHLYHAGKGVSEAIRGVIEAIPVVGLLFAWIYNPPIRDGRSWWMIKMYNPDKPDGLDRYMQGWHNWKNDVPQLYVNADI